MIIYLILYIAGIIGCIWGFIEGLHDSRGESLFVICGWTLFSSVTGAAIGVLLTMTIGAFILFPFLLFGEAFQ